MMRRYAESTKVTVIQSRGEIERLLQRHKCTQFVTGVDYMNFSAKVQFRAHDRIVRFVTKLADPKKFRSTASYEQEDRRIWRSLLLVIKAKLEAVATGIATFEEEFLAHIVMPNDRTVAEIVMPQIASSYTTGKMPLLALQAASEE